MPRPNEDVSPSHGILSSLSPSFTIPPHVLGRTLQNPTLDAPGGGRRLQKPRPGVRIPCRNLTSQIVTHEEIAQEILQRSLKRNPASHSPAVIVDSVKGRALHFGASGDSTFAKSLSQRLANQLSSSQTDVEEKNAKDGTGNTGTMWSQSQGQAEIGEQNKLISSHGCYSMKDKQSTEMGHGDSNGMDVAVISRTVPGSPRLNHHSASKMDKVAEREIALKQLKELPKIKGGTRELSAELTAKRKMLVKSEICVQQAANKIGPSDLKDCDKIGVSKCLSSGQKHVCGHTLDDKSFVVLNVLPELSSLQDYVNVPTKTSESSSITALVVNDSEVGKANETLGKLEKPRKYITRTCKLKNKGNIKSNLTNGHCRTFKREMDLKRRSTRLSDKDAKNVIIKRKPGRPRKAGKKDTYSGGSPTPRSSVSGTSNSMIIKLSPKRIRLSDSNLICRGAHATSLNLCNSPSSAVVDLVKNSALKATSLGKVDQLSERKKESILAESSKQSIWQQKKPVRRYASEVEKLLKDEGARNMLLEANALGEVIDFTINEPSEERNKNNSIEVRESSNQSIWEQKKPLKRHSSEMRKSLNDKGARNVLLKTYPMKELSDGKVIKLTEEESAKSEAKAFSELSPQPPKKRFVTKIDNLITDGDSRNMSLEANLSEKSISVPVNRLSEGTKGSNKSEDQESVKLSSQHQKKVGKTHATEIEKLINDEGALNMLLQTSPLGESIIMGKKPIRSRTKEMRIAAQQNILYKASLVRKSILQSSSSSSRPRRKIIFNQRKEMERKRKYMETKRKLLGKRSKLEQENSGKKGGKEREDRKKVREEREARKKARKERKDRKKVREEKRGVTVGGEVQNDIAEKKEAETNNSAKFLPKNEPPLPFDMSVHRVVLPAAAKTSRIIRRHSSSSSFSSRSSSPIGATCKSRRGSTSSNSAKEIVCSVHDSPDCLKQSVELERLNEALLKSNVEQGRLQCMIRSPNARNAVTMPRMSAAVRLKLNTEMSKNFQKGLNVGSAKCISAKVSPKAKKSPVALESSLKLNTVLDMKAHSSDQAANCIKIQQSQGALKDIKFIPAVNVACQSKSPANVATSVMHSKTLSTTILNSDGAKELDLLHGQELAVCVKKLQERRDVSITAIDESGERTVEFPNSISANSRLTAKLSTICVPTVVPKQSSSVGAMVEVVPKLKKLKNPKTTFLKNIIGKEHRIVGLPLSPIASYNSVIKSLENVTQKQKKKAATKLERRMDSKECFRQRSSGRQNAGTYNYKEICLRRYENFVQIILTPSSTKMKNSLNVQVLHEFRDALQQLRRDEFCRVVLVTSTGSTFCQGLDLHSLIHTNTERRKKAALELSEALKDFLRVLAMFNKPIVAGVHGATVGLGVTMLPFFDVVYASDKATFHAPYARLGQIPEGAAVLTLPLMLGNAVTSELLFGSRKLTSSEALHYGLVTRVFWPDTFQEELIPNIKAMASQSSQSMQAMKALLRLNLRVKLEATLDSESSLLVQHWCSPECQRNFRKFLETSDEVFFQRQKKDPS